MNDLAYILGYGLIWTFSILGGILLLFSLSVGFLWILARLIGKPVLFPFFDKYIKVYQLMIFPTNKGWGIGATIHRWATDKEIEEWKER